VREANASLRALGRAEGRELMQSLGNYIVEREK
jgi:hypothetical protein